MKQLSNAILILCILLNMPLYADADAPTCTYENNLFFSKIKKDESNPKGCIEDSEKKKDSLSLGISEINKKLIMNNLSGCSNLLSKDSVVKTKEACRKITRCSDEIVQFSASSSNEIYCSLNTIKFNYDKAKFYDSAHSFFNKQEPKILAVENIESILQNLGIDNKEIFKCPISGSQKTCSQEISGLEDKYVKKVLDEIILKSLKGNEKPAKDMKGRIKGNLSNRIRPQTYLNRLSFVANVPDNNSINVVINNDDDAKALLQRNLLESELGVELSKLGIDFLEEKKKYSNMLTDSSVPYRNELEKYKTLYLKIYNEAAKTRCSTSIYNMKYVCKEIAKSFKNVKDINQKDILLAYSGDLSLADKKVKTGNDEYFLNLGILDSAGNGEKFDFNQFLKVYDYSNACIDEFGQDAVEGSVGGVNARTRFSQSLSQRTEAIKSVAESSNSKATSLMKDITNDIENSDDSSLKRISKSARLLTSASSGHQFENNESLKKITEPISSSVDKLNQIASGDKNLSETNTSSDFKNFQNIARNALPNTGTQVQSQPQSSDYHSIENDNDQNLVATQSVMKRISELEEREKALKKKADEKIATSGESEEMKQLRLQIEELRGQLAKKDNVDALGNKIVSVKDIAGSAGTTAKYPTAANTSGATTAIVSKRDSRDSVSERDSYSASTARSNFSDSSVMGPPQDIRTPASVSGAKSAIGGSSKTGSSSASAFGMVLTRNGDLTEDLTKIADNPKEADLIILAEKSNGQPFIIRENGLLVQVVIEKDDAGKAIIENGKPKLKKIKLSKDKEALVAREFNMVREAKTVRDTVRLQELRRTTEDAVK